MLLAQSAIFRLIPVVYFPIAISLSSIFSQTLGTLKKTELNKDVSTACKQAKI